VTRVERGDEQLVGARRFSAEQFTDLLAQLVAIAAAHELYVDRERCSRVEVTELGLDVGEVLAAAIMKVM
jgi:hypothetical protein